MAMTWLLLCFCALSVAGTGGEGWLRTEVESVIATSLDTNQGLGVEEVRIKIKGLGCSHAVCQARVQYVSEVARGQILEFSLAVPTPYVEYSELTLLGFSPSWTRLVSSVVSLTDDFGSGMLVRSVEDFLRTSGQPIEPGAGGVNSSLAPELRTPPPPKLPWETDNGTGVLESFAQAQALLEEQAQNLTYALPPGRRRTLLQATAPPSELLSSVSLDSIKSACTDYSTRWANLKRSSLYALAAMEQQQAGGGGAGASAVPAQSKLDELARDASAVLTDCLANAATATSSKCLSLTDCAANELQHMRYNLDLKLSSAYTTELLYLRNAYTREIQAFRAGEGFQADWEKALGSYKELGQRADNASDKIMGLLDIVNASATTLEDRIQEISDFYSSTVEKHAQLIANNSVLVSQAASAARSAVDSAQDLLEILQGTAYGAELLAERNRIYMQTLLEKAVSASAVWGSLSKMLETIHTRAETKASLVRALFSGLQDSISDGWSPLLLDPGRRAVDLFDPATGAARWFPVQGPRWVSIRPPGPGVAGRCPGVAGAAVLERHTLSLQCNLVPLSLEQYSFDSVLQTVVLAGPRGCGNGTCFCKLLRRWQVLPDSGDQQRQHWVARTAASFASLLGYNESLPSVLQRAEDADPWLGETGWTQCGSEEEAWGLPAVRTALAEEFCVASSGSGSGDEWDWVRQGYCNRSRPLNESWDRAGVPAGARNLLLGALDLLCQDQTGAAAAAGGVPEPSAAKLGLWVSASSGRVFRHLTWPYLTELSHSVLDSLSPGPGGQSSSGSGNSSNLTSNLSSPAARAQAFARVLEAQLGAECLVSPASYRAWVGTAGGSALGTLNLVHRHAPGSPPALRLRTQLVPYAPHALEELERTQHPALQFWDDALAHVPMMRRQGQQLKSAAQGELPTPVATETRRGRREQTYGLQGARGSVTLNGAGVAPDARATVQFQMQEDVAVGVVTSPDLSEVWLLNQRRRNAEAFVQPTDDELLLAAGSGGTGAGADGRVFSTAQGEVIQAYWRDAHDSLLRTSLHFLGYPYCLDNPCPLRATSIDPTNGLVTSYRTVLAGAGGDPRPIPGPNSTHPFGAAYSSSPAGLAPYLIDLPERLITLSPNLRAREGTPLYLFEPAPAGAAAGGGGLARAAAWMTVADNWLGSLSPTARAQYLAQWGGLARLPLRRDSAARLLDATRNPFAKGIFDPREAGLSLGHFQAELEIPPRPDTNELFAAFQEALARPPNERLRAEWLAGRAPRTVDLKLPARLCRTTKTTQAGGLCAILRHYYMHWLTDGEGVRFYPRDWELELLVRRTVPLAANSSAATNDTAAGPPDPLNYCPQTLELRPGTGGTQQRGVRLAYTSLNPTTVGAGGGVGVSPCVLQLEAPRCQVLHKLRLSELRRYQTYDLDLTNCRAIATDVRVLINCSGEAQFAVLCLQGTLDAGTASLPSLEIARDNALTIRVQQQSELAPLYRQLGETLSGLALSGSEGSAGVINLDDLNAAAEASLADYSVSATIQTQARQALTALSSQAQQLEVSINNSAAALGRQYTVLIAEAKRNAAELKTNISTRQNISKELEVMYDQGAELKNSLSEDLEDLRQYGANLSTQMLTVLQDLQNTLTLQYSCPPGVTAEDLSAFLNLTTDYCYRPLPLTNDSAGPCPCTREKETKLFFGFCSRPDEDGSCESCANPAGGILAGLLIGSLCCFFMGIIGGLAALVVARRGGEEKLPDRPIGTRLFWGLFIGLNFFLGLGLLITMLTLNR